MRTRSQRHMCVCASIIQPTVITVALLGGTQGGGARPSHGDDGPYPSDPLLSPMRAPTTPTPRAQARRASATLRTLVLNAHGRARGPGGRGRRNGGCVRVRGRGRERGARRAARDGNAKLAAHYIKIRYQPGAATEHASVDCIAGWPMPPHSRPRAPSARSERRSVTRARVA